MNENELEIINLDEVAEAANAAVVDNSDETLSILAGAGIGMLIGAGLTVGAYFAFKKVKAYRAKKAAEKAKVVEDD